MFASWQRADANNSRLTSDDATTNTFSLGYTYSLSKRTAIYGLASYQQLCVPEGREVHGRQRGLAARVLTRRSCR